MDADWLEAQLERLAQLVAEGDTLEVVRMLGETTRAARRAGEQTAVLADGGPLEQA